MTTNIRLIAVLTCLLLLELVLEIVMYLSPGEGPAGNPALPLGLYQSRSVLGCVWQGPEFTVGALRWNEPEISYSLENCPRSLDCESAHEAVRDAMGAWSARLPIRFTETSQGGDIAIYWKVDDCGDGIGMDGRGGVYAYAHLPLAGGLQATDGDIYFDDSEIWTTADAPTARRVHLETVALHEIGHALGLPHSADPNSTMYSCYCGPRSLSPDAIQMAQAIYGVP